MERKTKHFNQRTAQRGITHDMVAFVLEHGRITGDKYEINRDAAKSLLRKLQLARHQLMIGNKPLTASGLACLG